MLKYSNYLKLLIYNTINESFDVVQTKFGNNHPDYDDGSFKLFSNFIVSYFLLNDEVIEVSFYKDKIENKNTYYVKFKIGEFKDNKEDIKFVIENKLDVRRNDALKIFNRVIFVIKSFTEQHETDEIIFEGARSNLQNLYQILVNNKRFSDKMKRLGFVYVKTEDEGIFTFKKE